MRIKAASTIIFGLVCAAPHVNAQAPVLVQGTLTAPGSKPFHLKASITEGREADPAGEIEMDWISPTKWRRVIQSHDFSQTLIVNGNKVFDQHSDDYLPLGLETLATTMVDPMQILSLYQPGDRQVTKANGGSSESGMICYDAKHSLCTRSRFGMMESVVIPGHSIELMSYENFEGKRIARRIVSMVSVGDFLTATITELKPLRKEDEDLFVIPQSSSATDRLAVERLAEPELRNLAVETPEIIWPQVLDGAETGEASFYVGIDPQGRIREVLPVQTANERSNDSAIRQIKRWKFKASDEEWSSRSG